MYYYPIPPIDSVHEEDGCELCHEEHLESGRILDGCQTCQDTKCVSCKGARYILDGDTECPACLGGGRTLDASQKFLLKNKTNVVG